MNKVKDQRVERLSRGLIKNSDLNIKEAKKLSCAFIEVIEDIKQGKSEKNPNSQFPNVTDPKYHRE